VNTALVYLWAPFANLLWYLETVVMGTISLLVWPFDRSGEMQHACARWWCPMVAVTIGARIRVHGVEQVQAGCSYVYVANHASLSDTPALFACVPEC
jgi:1-acyl-sn-glycerol-3-phosphate acyltransferase